MTKFWFNDGKRRLGDKLVDLVADDLRVLLVRTGSNWNDQSHEFVADLTLEYDGTNYARKVVANRAFVTENSPNHRVRVTADDIVWTDLDPASGGDQAIAFVVFVQVTNDADSFLLLASDEGGFPFNGTGSDPVTLEFLNDLLRLVDA